MSDEIFDEEVNYRPYKVTYTEKNVNTESNNEPMLQMIENSGNAVEKFLFKSNSKILIGNHLGKITIVKSADIKDLLCEIYYSNEGYCAVSYTKESIVLKRGSKSVCVDEKGYV